MNNKKRYMIASVFLTILIVFIWANPFKKEIWDTNAKLLEDPDDGDTGRTCEFDGVYSI